MDNFFISKHPFGSKNNSFISFFNKGLRFLKFGYHLRPLPDPAVDMSTIEQRINYFHLLDCVIANEIAGDVVELGCFTGQCAMLFQKVIEMRTSGKKLHLYDSFESKFTINGSVEDVLHNNFIKAGLNLPTLHKGYFQDTIPIHLPGSISFAHIDCGSGSDPLIHKRIITHCLESIYPRMSKGAVCVMMDYHDKTVNDSGYDANPGVKLACDDFLSMKPEQVISLYGNQYSHGFFRKA